MSIKAEAMSNEQLRQIEYTYGGDYNEYNPSDNNFNCNGIVGPDRQLNPHAYELAYQYQNIWTTMKDVQKGEVNVYNENFFADLSNCALAWSLIEDGVETRTEPLPTSTWLHSRPRAFHHSLRPVEGEGQGGVPRY